MQNIQHCLSRQPLRKHIGTFVLLLFSFVVFFLLIVVLFFLICFLKHLVCVAVLCLVCLSLYMCNICFCWMLLSTHSLSHSLSHSLLILFSSLSLLLLVVLSLLHPQTVVLSVLMHPVNNHVQHQLILNHLSHQSVQKIIMVLQNKFYLIIH